MKSKPIPPKEIYMRRPRGRIPADVKAWLEVNEHWTGWEIAVCNCGKWYGQMDPLAPYYTEMNWCKKCGYNSFLVPNKAQKNYGKDTKLTFKRSRINKA